MDRLYAMQMARMFQFKFKFNLDLYKFRSKPYKINIWESDIVKCERSGFLGFFESVK